MLCLIAIPQYSALHWVDKILYICVGPNRFAINRRKQFKFGKELSCKQQQVSFWFYKVTSAGLVLFKGVRPISHLFHHRKSQTSDCSIIVHSKVHPMPKGRHSFIRFERHSVGTSEECLKASRFMSKCVINHVHLHQSIWHFRFWLILTFRASVYGINVYRFVGDLIDQALNASVDLFPNMAWIYLLSLDKWLMSNAEPHTLLW